MRYILPPKRDSPSHPLPTPVSTSSDGRVEPVEVLEPAFMRNRPLALSWYPRKVSWTSGCMQSERHQMADQIVGQFN